MVALSPTYCINHHETEAEYYIYLEENHTVYGICKECFKLFGKIKQLIIDKQKMTVVNTYENKPNPKARIKADKKEGKRRNKTEVD